jgi:hypothetical protein
MVRALEAQGWRIHRRRSFPNRARWDFSLCGDALVPLNAAADEAGRQLCDGRPILPRHPQ